jgi:hypothetical protein
MGMNATIAKANPPGPESDEIRSPHRRRAQLNRRVGASSRSSQKALTPG